MVALSAPPPTGKNGEARRECEVSVVMPCLNESRTVGRCVEKALRALRELDVEGEVVVADNGSTDGSPEIARVHGARVVPVDRRGYGCALQAGIRGARGRYVIMGDADDSYDFTALEPFVARLREGYDLVMGNRFRGGIRPGAMPWHHRYIGNPVLTGILNLFFRTPIGDAHCGLRGFRKDACLRLGLSAPGMEFASEMVVKACLHRQRITEVPTVLHPDGRDRPPHLRSFRDGWRHLRFLLLHCPTWLFLVPAGAMMALGLALIAWVTVLGASAGLGAPFRPHSMLLGALCTIVGYQTLWLWASARASGRASGALPGRASGAGRLRLEHGLAAGAALAAAGLTLGAGLVSGWTRGGFGPLDVRATLPPAIWCALTIVVGIQTVYGSFFLSMLGVTAAPAGDPSRPRPPVEG